ncbi:hypothetical protein GZH47_05955 [Paenibacillus rhizovicinus]|uniref:Uncharacterized protein n=1 Tax=Paenibacillus rhizovicinus TaxID=2704463 RepID=A0A6C0NWY5_9BACL|nr:hypothetical protein [Paenibacillus rhizovicinus]QHW30436.1 hypothetical protein GZH47_05955 [Paenibacillus rhizovicinus]
MEELLKLLFSNFYIVVIIVGFLLTMLNKARGKQNPGQNRMPTFGGGTADRPQASRLDQRQPQPERPQHIPAGQPQRPSQRDNAQRRQTAPAQSGVYQSQRELTSGEGESMEMPVAGTLTRALEAQRLEESKPKAPAGSLSGKAAPSGTDTDPFRMPQGDQLRQAFIMAEVLGPPRSKRPLRQK